MFTDSRIRWIGLGICLLAGCGGGGDNGNDPPDPAPIVSVTPARDTLTVGTGVQLTATVTGSSNTSVTWSVSGGGTVSTTGFYTAGGSAGVAQVVAQSVADPSSKDTARIVVAPAPGSTINVPDSVAQGGTFTASAAAVTGITYSWSVIGGTIASGQGTATVQLVGGGGTTIQVTCLMANLADSTTTTTRNAVLVAGPVITSFAVARDTVTTGQGTTLIPVFENGAGGIDNGVGVATSGGSIAVGPFTTGYVPTTYRLTVTGFRGAAATAQVSVVSVNPPRLNLLDALYRRFPAGGRGQFLIDWNRDPRVVASIAPDVGVVTTADPFTPVVTTPGNIQYTMSVRSPADSVVSDTITFTAVPPAPGAFRVLLSLRDKMDHTATRLADGRVLITGGRILDQDLVHGKVEIYDPATEQFQGADSLLRNRSGHLATLLPDGRVLVAGGASLTNDIEFFDPATGHWSLGPVLPDDPAGAVPMPDGRVLLVLRSGPAQLLDLSNNTLTPTGAPAGPTIGIMVFDLGGGRVMVAGAPQVISTQVYDFATGVFTTVGSMHEGHRRGVYVPLPGGKLFVAGGTDNSLVRATSGEVFDVATGVWTVVGKPAIARIAGVAALLQNGKVLIAGGQMPGGAPAAFSEIFDPVTGQFTPTLQGQVVKTWLGQLTPLTNGKALTTGGLREGATNGVVELFEP